MTPRDRIGELAGTGIAHNAPPGSHVLDVRRLGELGVRRTELELALNRNRRLILEEVERTEEAGGNRRLTLVADLTGIHRDTLRSALHARRNGARL